MRNPAGLWGGRAAHTPLLEEIKKAGEGGGGDKHDATISSYY